MTMTKIFPTVTSARSFFRERQHRDASHRRFRRHGARIRPRRLGKPRPRLCHQHPQITGPASTPSSSFPLLKAHFVMLQRNLLYTAITRGKKKVSSSSENPPPMRWLCAIANRSNAAPTCSKKITANAGGGGFNRRWTPMNAVDFYVTEGNKGNYDGAEKPLRLRLAR